MLIDIFTKKLLRPKLALKLPLFDVLKKNQSCTTMYLSKCIRKHRPNKQILINNKTHILLKGYNPYKYTFFDCISHIC